MASAKGWLELFSIELTASARSSSRDSALSKTMKVDNLGLSLL
jgi:hypothetical protein